MIRTISIATLLCAGLLAGCAQQPVVAAAPPYPPVPPPLAEQIPKPPVTPDALVWRPGYWDWNGTSYVWQPGQYVSAAGHGPLWQLGWWNMTSTGWRWEPAHWR